MGKLCISIKRGDEIFIIMMFDDPLRKLLQAQIVFGKITPLIRIITNGGH